MEEKRKSGGGRKRKGGDGEEFVNDSSDMGDWPKDGEGGERRRKDVSGVISNCLEYKLLSYDKNS